MIKRTHASLSDSGSTSDTFKSGRLILVSNRLPVTISSSDGAQTIDRSSGGLIAGLDPLHQDTEGIWIGHPGVEPDNVARAVLSEMRLEPVEIPESEYSLYYEEYSNRAIWPLFHYLLEFCDFDPLAFAAYKRVNERFAEAVIARAEEGDTIWIHDYQLMLLPAMLRARLPDVRIGFFLHIPFPASEMFRVIPQREEILLGLLGADLIGVHTYEYADHIATSIRRILGLEVRQGNVALPGRKVQIEAHPLGIDVKGQREHAFSPEADNALARYRRLLRGRQVILGVDRLDYTKGIPLKLRALEQLFENHPRFRNRVVFIQIAIPTRTNITDYDEQRAAVEQLASEINGRFGRPGVVPIQYLYRSVSPAELGALYRLADIAFISPVRDGLNLVAKEYVACSDENDGVLVLSEFAGAASELTGALRVNPWDIGDTARQLERGLDMPVHERKFRMSSMRQRVDENDVHRWVERFIEALNESAESRSLLLAPEARGENIEILAEKIASAKSSLIILDYEVLINEFSKRYEDVNPTGSIIRILNDLAAGIGTDVYLCRNGSRHSFGAKLKDAHVSLIAEGGLWIKFKDRKEWELHGSNYDVSWKEQVRSILDEYVSRTPGTSVEENPIALRWSYSGARHEAGEWQSRDLATHLEDALGSAPVEVFTQSDTVEIRQQGLDMDQMIRFIESERGPFDFVFAVRGDSQKEGIFVRLGIDDPTMQYGKIDSTVSVLQLLTGFFQNSPLDT